MLGTSFYNNSIRRVTSTFGNLFNQLDVNQYDSDDILVKTIRVPISYARKQHFHAKLHDDVAGINPAVNLILPRMSFSFEGLSYDSERQISPQRRIKRTHATDSDLITTVNSFTPYNMDFELNVVCKNVEDSLQILEQIVPYFTPEFNLPIKFTDTDTRDVTLLLNAITPGDNADDGFNTNRMIEWTLSFTARAWIVGVSKDGSIIKTAIANLASSKDDLGAFLTDETIELQVTPSSASRDDVYTCG